MKKTTLLFLLVLFSKFAMAQITASITVIQGSDYQTPLAGASVTLLGETVISDADGIANFTISLPSEDAYYEYNVTASDYVSFQGWLYVSPTSESAAETAYLNPAFNISFTVLDKNEVPVPGASITINDNTVMTGADGKADFGKIFRGGWYEYSYTITKDGYADYSSSATVVDQDVVVDPVMLNLAWQISFTVKDASDLPVEGAMVSLDNENMNTGADGTVVFSKKINGDYPYQVSKSSFIDASGVVTVTDGNTDAPVTLTAGYNLSLTVINGAAGTAGLANDTITIGAISKITNENGEVLFGVAPGIVEFTTRKAGFTDVPVSVEITGQDVSRTIYMIPEYTVTFTVLDAMSYMPVEGAMVAFNGASVPSDANGIVVFAGLSASETDYGYTVTSDAGYNQETGTISLPLSSTYVEQYNIVNQNVTLIKPGISIALTNGMMMYFGGATVNVNGTDYIYDTGLGSAYIQIAPGDYPYVVTPDDETKAILRGTLTVGTSGYDYLALDAVDGFKVEIYATDKDNNPLAGAQVIFAGDTVNTDDTGDAIFNRMPGGDFSYSITMNGYRPINNAPLSVVTSDLFEIALMHINGLLISFHITNGTNPVAGAEVIFDGETLLTDANGNVSFEGKTAGTYSYSVSKESFTMDEGSVEVTDQDVVKEIVLLPNGIKDNSINTASIYPNPVSDIMKISLPAKPAGQVTVIVINESGATVISGQFRNPGSLIGMNMKEVPGGIYFVKITSPDSEQVIKIMKTEY